MYKYRIVSINNQGYKTPDIIFYGKQDSNFNISNIKTTTKGRFYISLIGVGRIELPLQDPQPRGLPLSHTPKTQCPHKTGRDKDRDLDESRWVPTHTILRTCQRHAH
jgi:hypothetical protein